MKKVIVISGGSDGLGYEVAKILTPNHQVVILAPDEARTKSAAEKLSCDFEICDVSNYKVVEKTVSRIITKRSRIDCLVNNAGIWIQGELTSNEPDIIKRVLEINSLGTMFLTRAVLPQMKTQKDGLIINIISQAGLYGKAERSAYTASKFAVTGFTKSMQLELAKYGIRVTGIYPGKMNTKLFEKVGVVKNMNDALDPKDVARTIEFILSLKKPTQIVGLELKHIDN